MARQGLNEKCGRQGLITYSTVLSGGRATLKLNAADAPSNNEGANEMKKESSGRISASPFSQRLYTHLIIHARAVGGRVHYVCITGWLGGWGHVREEAVLEKTNFIKQSTTFCRSHNFSPRAHSPGVKSLSCM